MGEGAIGCVDLPSPPPFHFPSVSTFLPLHLPSPPLLPSPSPAPPTLHHQASEQFYPSSDSDEESEDSDGSEGSEEKNKKKKKPKPLVMDPDHRLLLRSVKPLLQSRNASVSGGVRVR